MDSSVSNNSVEHKYTDSISKQFYFKQFTLPWVRRLNIKTILYQVIKFSISTKSSFIWPIDRTLSGATTPGQSGPGSYGYEDELHILQNSSITQTLPSDFFCDISRTLIVCREGFTPLQRCCWCILQLQPTGKSLFYFFSLLPEILNVPG